MKHYKLILFSILLGVFQWSTAQTCCSGGVPLSNNIGLPTLQKGSWQFGFSYDYNDLNTLQIGSRNINDDSRLRITHSVLANFGYSFTDTFSVEVLLSWVNQRRRITQLGNANLDETSGIGDAIVLARYVFISNEVNSLSMGIGGKLPLGSSTQRNDQGILLNADLQPGSHAFDYIFIATFSQKLAFRKTMNVTTRVTYRATGTNKSYQEINEYKFGNEFQAFLGVSDQLFVLGQLINPSLTFKYRNAIQDQINQTTIENTGGDWIFMIPSLSINITQQLWFTTNVEIPIYAKVQGTQLTPTFRLNTGFLFQIVPKTNLNITL